MSIDEVAKLLARTEACASLSDGERRRLASSGKIQVAFEGATLLEEGTDARSMLLLLDGEVSILKSDENGRVREIATLGPGSVLGEGSLLADGPRSATVRAVGTVRTFEIDRGTFELLLEGQDPAAVKMLLSMARALARRQKETNERLVGLLVKVGQADGAQGEVTSCIEELVIEWE